MRQVERLFPALGHSCCSSGLHRVVEGPHAWTPFSPTLPRHHSGTTEGETDVCCLSARSGVRHAGTCCWPCLTCCHRIFFFPSYFSVVGRVWQKHKFALSSTKELLSFLASLCPRLTVVWPIANFLSSHTGGFFFLAHI